MMGQLTFAKRIAQSNFMRLPRPYKLLLALTYRCNAKCLTCNIWKRKVEGELALEDLRTFFAKNNHFSWVNLTGGEIFLRRDLPDILKTILTECKGLCLLNFATNGLQPKRIDWVLAEMPAHAVARTIATISIDAPAGINDRIRGVKGSFKKSVETFSRLWELERKDLSVYFGLTLSNHNVGMLQDIFDALKEEIPTLRYQDLHVNVAHSSPHYYFNKGNDVASNEDIMRDVKVHYAKQPRIPHSTVQFLEKRYLHHLLRYLNTKKTPIPCHALSASCFIDPQGMVYPCIIYDRPLGNLREVDFDLGRIWKKQESLALQQDIKNGKCPNCWLACEAYQSIMGGLLR